MQRRIFGGLFLLSLFLVAGGGAQQFPSDRERPVWTMDFIKVKPGMFGLALGYLDDNWMRVREEAKRQGAVLGFHRFGEEGSDKSDQTIVLLTEFKNQAAYDGREVLFASIRMKLPNNTSGVLRPTPQEDLYQSVSTRVFQDYSDMNSVRFQLLSKN
jgi:hypothetical protein